MKNLKKVNFRNKLGRRDLRNEQTCWKQNWIVALSHKRSAHSDLSLSLGLVSWLRFGDSFDGEFSSLSVIRGNQEMDWAVGSDLCANQSCHCQWASNLFLLLRFTFLRATFFEYCWGKRSLFFTIAFSRSPIDPARSKKAQICLDFMFH